MSSSPLFKRIWKHKIFYLFMLPGIIWFLIFFRMFLYTVCRWHFGILISPEALQGVRGQGSNILISSLIIINLRTSSATRLLSV